ncbi:hypothetical protein Ancab_028904 [Ancistrocladus abbreviatus]
MGDKEKAHDTQAKYEEIYQRAKDQQGQGDHLCWFGGKELVNEFFKYDAFECHVIHKAFLYYEGSYRVVKAQLKKFVEAPNLSIDYNAFNLEYTMGLKIVKPTPYASKSKEKGPKEEREEEEKDVEIRVIVGDSICAEVPLTLVSSKQQRKR